MIKSYPLNIPKVQSKGSKISNLEQNFIFTKNCTPNYPYRNHFSYSLTIVQINIFEGPQNIFPNQNPRPQTIEPAPSYFNYRVPPWANISL